MKNFTQKVYNIVKKIKSWEVLTYKQVAIKAGNPKAYRAVWNILNKNYDDSIPCHRVIRSDHKIGWYNRWYRKKIILLKSEWII